MGWVDVSGGWLRGRFTSGHAALVSMGLAAGGAFLVTVLAASATSGEDFADFAAAFAAETIGLTIATAGVTRSQGRFIAAGCSAQRLRSRSLVTSLTVAVAIWPVLTVLFGSSLGTWTAILLLAESATRVQSECMRYARSVQAASVTSIGAQRVLMVAVMWLTLEPQSSASETMARCAASAAAFCGCVLLVSVRRPGVARDTASDQPWPSTRSLLLAALPPTFTETVSALRTQLLMIIILARVGPDISKTVVFSFRFFVLGGLMFTYIDLAAGPTIASIVARRGPRDHDELFERARRTFRRIWLFSVTGSAGLALALLWLGEIGQTQTAPLGVAALIAATGSFGGLALTSALLSRSSLNHVLPIATAAIVGLLLAVLLPASNWELLVFATMVATTYLASAMVLLLQKKTTGLWWI